MMKPADRAPTPAITGREVKFATPFFHVIGKRLAGEATGEPYYSLDLLDYVCVVAVTGNGSFVLVRQFRPAVETVTLEIPAGHVERGQSPEDAARVELVEETGYTATSVRLVGCLRPDTGRLANRMWIYFAEVAEPDASWTPEAGIEVVVASRAELSQWLSDGTFGHALHVASVLLAAQSGSVTL